MKPTDGECPWQENVSAVFDGELEEDERIATEEHLQTCELCREALEELAEIRTGLQSIPLLRQDDSSVLGRTRSRRRSRTLTFPVVLAAALAGMILGGSVVLIVQDAGTGVPEPLSATVDRVEQTDSLGLSRFDHGERALIFKAPKNERTSELGGAR